MPIANMFWRPGWNRDIHVLRGQTSPTLSAVALVFAHDDDEEDSPADYMAANPGDVTLFFTPLFRGVQSGNLFEGHGLHFAMTTGELEVDGNVPPIPKNNFIVEVLATNTTDGTTLVRVHCAAAGRRRRMFQKAVARRSPSVHVQGVFEHVHQGGVHMRGR